MIFTKIYVIIYLLIICRRINLGTAVVLGVSLAVAIPLCIIKKVSEDKISLLCKFFAVALFALGTFRMFLNDNFVWVINGGNYGNEFYKTQDLGQSILRWLTYLSFMVYPCAAFFKLRTVRNFAVYFCTPVTIVANFFYGDFLAYFLTSSGRGFLVPSQVRHIEFALELILPIVMGILLRFRLGHKFAYKSPREWKYFCVLLPITLLCVFPVYLPQSVFGFSSLYMHPFSLQHFILLGFLLFALIVLYGTLRFRTYEQRLCVCIFLALYLVMHYNSIYLMDMKLSRLPLQLCNLGAYLALVALIIRKQAFSNFVLIANVSGTIIALLLPDLEEGLLSFWNIHHYIEHMLVFIVPLLMVSLRLMERPDKRAIKHYFIGFSIYFVVCATCGVLLNGFLYRPGNFFYDEVNYFYLFDDTVTKVLLFLNFTYDWPLVVNGYTVYPLYMMLIYVLFSVFCMGFYSVYHWLCKIGDDHCHLRRIRISLYREKFPNSKRMFKEEYTD